MTDPTAPLARLTPLLPLLARFTFAAVLRASFAFCRGLCADLPPRDGGGGL